MDGAADPSGSLSKTIWRRFSMDIATGRYRISECLLSSTAANSSIYISVVLAKRDQMLGFWATIEFS